MESISFTEFAKAPKLFVTRGLSQGECVRDLFIHISKLEGGEGSFFNKVDSTLSQYYSIGMFEIYNELEKQVLVAIDKVDKYPESEEVPRVIADNAVLRLDCSHELLDTARNRQVETEPGGIDDEQWEVR